MTTKVVVENKTIIQVLTGVVIYVVALALLWSFREAIVIVLLSFFLALALNPPVSFISRHIPGNSRALATAFSYLLVVVFFGVILYSTIPPLLDETREFVDRIPTFVDELQEGDSAVSSFIDRYQIDIEAREFVDNVAASLGSQGSSILSNIGQVGDFIFKTLTIIVITFFMLIEGPSILQRFWQAYPKNNVDEHKEVAKKMYGVITGYINGQMLIALIAGITSMIMMLILGVPFAVPLAGIVGLLGLIPMIGATLGAVVVVAVSMFESVTLAIIMAVFFLIYQWIENNFIQPQIQAKTLGLSPLVVLVAVIFGFSSAGIIGGFISIPVAGCLKVLLDYHIKNQQKAKKSAAK